MFLDTATIYCKAGNGGDGKTSFHREKYVPNGGPDGGDGGKGGSIYVVGDSSMTTLISFRYTQHFRAGNGETGGTKNCAGKAGDDLIITVPRGTVIRDSESGGIILDVFTEGERILLFEGGRGGRGNCRFATATRKAPNFSELGEKTIERKLNLELKTIADVGLVGFPNVGKSTILSVISAAKPKIANYHFTTLSPNLGVVKVDEEGFLVADIPGLIEGASEGVGLGHAFLRHVERVRLIVHVLDMAGSEGRDPVEDYIAVRKELEAYRKSLATLPELVIGNKCDLVEDRDAAIKDIESRIGKKVFPISAATTEGIEELKRLVFTELQKLPAAKPLEYEPFHYDDEDTTGFYVQQADEETYIVGGGLVENLARKVVVSDQESFRWFQKVLKDKGVIAELKRAGMKDGDTVCIMDLEFEYFD